MQILLRPELFNQHIINRVHVMKCERKDEKRQHAADTVDDGRIARKPVFGGRAVCHDGGQDEVRGRQRSSGDLRSAELVVPLPDCEDWRRGLEDRGNGDGG